MAIKNAIRRGSPVIVAIGLALAILAPATSAATLPQGFQEEPVFSGLELPTSIAFAPDGKVIVAQKSGVIDVFDSVNDTSPTVLADLSEKVYNFWDRGLLGMVLDPQFPARPYLYVLYARDAEPGGTVPRWGGTSPSDPCPTPPGPTTDGCVITGRLSKLTLNDNFTVSSETPLITDWCQQFPSHSIGDLAFGPEGDLFVSGGEGAGFISADWGQSGFPQKNPCGDPPGGIGGEMTPPLAEGGALRAQDVRTLGDPTSLSGSVLRVDPDTGEGIPGNPYGTNPDLNARRIIAYGLRNPFRFAIRPGTNEVWVGDVGWGTWEEIDRVADPEASSPENLGWPCYEGGENGTSFPTDAYQGAHLDLCKSLYNQAQQSVTAPYFTYNHAAHVLPNETCTVGSSSTSGLAFYGGNAFPSKYDGALFFADYSRNCIWAMLPGANGLPDPTKVEAFDEGAAAPVNLIEGPEGALYYPDLTGGKIWRIDYSQENRPPTATAEATPQNGLSPLEVHLSAAQSTDPDPGDTLSYAWDLDGDGQFDDSEAVAPVYTYVDPGVHVAQVKVTDSHGASDVASVSIQVGNTPPSAEIKSPLASLTWAVGDKIQFSAEATDVQDGVLPASAYSWELIIHHCPSNCHEHFIETIENVKSGTIIAPDHEYPSWLELDLTVVDSGGLTATDSVEIHPETVKLRLESDPAGLQVIGNEGPIEPAGSALTVIKGSENAVIAPSPQTLDGVEYVFDHWTGGGAAAHDIVASENATLKAFYARVPGAPTIDGTVPGSPAASLKPRIRGAVSFGPPTKVEVFANANCTGAPGGTAGTGEFTGGGISIEVPGNATTALSARATNVAGASPCSGPISYTEDSTPPDTSIAKAPPAKQSVGVAAKRLKKPTRARARFEVEASEPVLRFECSFDGSKFAQCGSAAVYSRLKLGRHEFQVRAVDLAGNVDPTPASKAFRVVRKAKARHRSNASARLLGVDLLFRPTPPA